MPQRRFPLGNLKNIHSLFGVYDENLKLIESLLGVKIYIKTDRIFIEGEASAVEKASQALSFMKKELQNKGVIDKNDVINILRFSSGDHNLQRKLQEETIEVFSKKKVIHPKTRGQLEYVKSIKEYDITFALGPAGTGKTYLAMAMAVSSLRKGDVSRIILTRPAREAGESLGFLPGNIQEKLDPYLRPLYDALYEMMEPDRIEEYIDTGVIEVAPLAYMRGRTLNSAFIILDEAQNCTSEQIKMFLTRMGFDSKIVITADPTQSDLLGGKPIGLLEAVEVLKTISAIKFMYLTGEDVVRHHIVQQIIEAYEKRI